MANPSKDGLSPVHAGQPQVSAGQYNLQTAMAGQGAAGPHAFVDGTGVYNRPKRYRYKDWIEFYPSTTGDENEVIPESAVFHLDGGTARQFTSSYWQMAGDGFPVVNVSGYDIERDDDNPGFAKGRCRLLTAIPEDVLVSIDGLQMVDPGVQRGTKGSFWGPAPGSFKLYPGIPGGFRQYSMDYSGDGIVKFIRDTTAMHYWAVATADWFDPGGYYVPYVMAHACGFDAEDNLYGTPNYIYDGVDWSGVGAAGAGYTLVDPWPHIDLKIWLPRDSLARDPNIQSGDLVRYTFIPDGYERLDVVATGNYLDDKIGTVKMWIDEDVGGVPENIPPGWRLYSPMESAFPMGYNAGGGAPYNDLLATGSVESGSGGEAFRVVAFIERFE